jgi:hypothetical protein
MKHTLTLITALLLALLLAPVTALHAADTRYLPDWAAVTPMRITKQTDTRNDSLVKAVSALQPGDQLVIGAGTYSMERTWHIEVSGTAEAPIWIEAEKARRWCSLGRMRSRTW